MYKKSLEIARQDNLQHTECEVLIGMAELLRDIDVHEAKENSLEAVRLAETIQNPNLLEQAKTIDDYLQT